MVVVCTSALIQHTLVSGMDHKVVEFYRVWYPIPRSRIKGSGFALFYDHPSYGLEYMFGHLIKCVSNNEFIYSCRGYEILKSRSLRELQRFINSILVKSLDDFTVLELDLLKKMKSPEDTIYEDPLHWIRYEFNR